MRKRRLLAPGVGLGILASALIAANVRPYAARFAHDHSLRSANYRHPGIGPHRALGATATYQVALDRPGNQTELVRAASGWSAVPAAYARPRSAAKSAAARSVSESAPQAAAEPGRAAASASGSPQAVSGGPIGPPSNPVVSPPLKDIPPIPPHPKGDTFEVENPLLPDPNPAGLGPQTDPVLQRGPGPLASAPTPTGVNFDGVGVSNVAPSDDNGHVGPSHYVQWVNNRFAIYDKSGTLLYGPAAGNTLWTSLGGACAAHNDGDIVAQYDIQADRWVLTQFAIRVPASTGAVSHQCFAVSVTGDPLGSYYLYDFPTHPTLCTDYPKIGIWPEAYYMTSHLFPGTCSGFYVAFGLYSFERRKMLIGAPAQMLFIQTTAIPPGSLPSDLDSLTPPPAGSPNYIVGFAAPTTLRLFRTQADWDALNLSLTGPSNLTVGSFTPGCSQACVPQPSTTVRLDRLADRLMYRFAYRNFGDHESLVVDHTVNGTTTQGAIRWYEIRDPGGTPTIFQHGTFSPDSDHRFFGSIAMDNSGNMALGYSKGNSNLFTGVYLTGRLATDTLGEMGGEVTLQPGMGSQTMQPGGAALTRWGDYTSITVEPREGCTFWYTNQYLPETGAFNWKTRIAAARHTSCTSPPRGTITGVVTDCVTGAPIARAVVQTDTGFSAGTNAAGQYTIVLPPGTHNVTASASERNCSPSSSSPLTVADGGLVTQNFCLTGTPKLLIRTVVLDDSVGDNNGTINKNECFNINLNLDNEGCAGESGITATLSTSTAGVGITRPTSGYPNIPLSQTGWNVTPFGVATAPDFACGTPINFTLTIVGASGTETRSFSLPTCQTSVTQMGSIGPSDPTQNARMGRDSNPSVCFQPKTCPGSLGTGRRHYNAYTFTNDAPVPECITVRLTPQCDGGAEVQSVAYLGTFNPESICVNYLGDSGFVSQTGRTDSYGFMMPAGATFVVIVNEPTENAGCSNYTLTVEGLTDLITDGGRPPVPMASNNGPVCEGSTLQLTASSIPGATYAWTGPNGFTSSLQNPTIPGVTRAAAGQYQVIATVNACSSDPGFTTVVVNAASSAVITAPSFVCANSDGNTASVPDAGPDATYVWTITNGTITAGQGTPTITFTAGSAGVVTLGVTVTTPEGCNSTGSAIVAISTHC